MKNNEQAIEVSFKSLHGEEVYEQLKKCEVTIFGLGGLGSNVAMLLVRAGIGKLTLIDYDKVEGANLNRQFYFMNQIGQLKTEALYQNLSAIGPWTQLERTTVKVTKENLHEFLPKEGIVVEAFDEATTKAWFINGCLQNHQIKVVSASGMAGYKSSNTMITKQQHQQFYLIGDDEPIMPDGCQLMAPRVMIAASHQANMVVRLIMGINQV